MKNVKNNIVVLIAFIIEFYYPDSIIKYNSETVVFIDRVVALVVISFSYLFSA
ncbi:MAG TPA: hypothetical protein VN370_08710 [Desulfitobacteriaceae bacterium]|nr:hypothetical protein [Desulfitobacteriaceae bacterium]